MPVNVLPLKVTWHGKTYPRTTLTFKLGPETCRTDEFLDLITFAVDEGTLKIIAESHGRVGKAWVPLGDYPAGRSEVQYIPLVDRDGGPVADLHLIIIMKPRVRPPEFPNIVRYQPGDKSLASRVDRILYFPGMPPSASRVLELDKGGLPMYKQVQGPDISVVLGEKEEMRKLSFEEESTAIARIQEVPSPLPLIADHSPQPETHEPQEQQLVVHTHHPFIPPTPYRADISDVIQARHEAQFLPNVEIVVREARDVPQLDVPIFVELNLRTYDARTSLRPVDLDGRATWDENFTISIAPEDDLILAVVTEAGGVLGCAVLKGDRLMGFKAHDVLLPITDMKGVDRGSLLVKVGGGSLHAIVDHPGMSVRDHPMTRQQWLSTLADRGQQMVHRQPIEDRKFALLGPLPETRVLTKTTPLEIAPPPKPHKFIVDRITVDRAPRLGSRTIDRPWDGRGSCLRVLDLKGREAFDLTLQIQDAEVLQQAAIEDALNAFFAIDMAVDEIVKLRLVQDSCVVATAKFRAADLLSAPGIVEVPLYSAEGEIDCQIVMECLPDGPIGYVFGSREEFLAAPAPIILH